MSEGFVPASQSCNQHLNLVGTALVYEVIGIGWLCKLTQTRVAHFDATLQLSLRCLMLCNLMSSGLEVTRERDR